MREVIFVGIAGALGAVSRYGLSSLSSRIFGERFPWGTLIVNIVGCLLIGFFLHLCSATEIFSRAYRIPLAIGFLGAFTTFSTFSYETLGYLKTGSWGMAGINIAANVVLGILAVIVGVGIGKLAVN